MIKHYFESVMTQTVPFLLAWEFYVLLITIFFCSIVIRLARIEKKINRLLYYKRKYRKQRSWNDK